MAESKTASATIAFGRVSGTGTGDDPFMDGDGNILGDDGKVPLSLVLDTVRNAEVYGENKTTFAPGETAYLLCYPHTAGLLLTSSAGSVSVINSNIPVEVTETISFAGSATATLSKMPMGAVSYQWKGNYGGAPLFTGQQVSVPSVITGVLEVVYNMAADRLELIVSSLNGQDELSVLVVATSPDGANANLTVTFSDDDDDGGGGATKEAVEILVTDYCTGDPVIGAHVYVDGQTLTTNANGIVYAGMLTPGQEYTLLITADGYTDSDKDVLNNDSFTI